jgi:hypothetical protein
MARGVRPSFEARGDVALNGRVWKAGRRKLGRDAGVEQDLAIGRRAWLRVGARIEAMRTALIAIVVQS